MGRYLSGRVRAQIASLDLIISVVVLMMLIGAIIVLITASSKPTTAKTAYGGPLFSNMETHFLTSYSVDETRLSTFWSRDYNTVKAIVLNNSLYETTTSDVCVFFTDQGHVYPNSGDILGPCSAADPCPRQSYIFIRPVVRMDRIVNMVIAVCRD